LISEVERRAQSDRFSEPSRDGALPAADLPAVVLMDETAISQQGEEFVLVAAVNPETRDLLHASVAPSRNTLTTRRFLSELAELSGRVPPIVVTDGASTAPSSPRLESRTSSADTA